jgi:hypothetical protein
MSNLSSFSKVIKEQTLVKDISFIMTLRPRALTVLGLLKLVSWVRIPLLVLLCLPVSKGFARPRSPINIVPIFGRSQVRILALRPAILIEVVRGFTKFLQINVGTVT